MAIHDPQIHLKGLARKQDSYQKDIAKMNHENKKLEGTLTSRKMTPEERKKYGLD